ncbi:MAG: hypothetical protein WD231_04740 [Candidatus Woykebacteria bacterium]
MDKKKLGFALIFTIVGFIFLQIPINQLAGSKVSFTLFDLFAPTAAAFFGGPIGIVSVFLMSLANFGLKVFQGTPVSTGVIIRLFPTLFAIYYFSRKDRSNIIIPILAMIIFWANPVGRQVWYYALFWLIPIAAYFRRDNLFIRSLGSTFSAHAVGGALWIWAFNLPASVWMSLIPVVAAERLLFASGISLSYVLLTNLLSYLEARRILPEKIFSLEKKYLFGSLNR